MNSPFHSKRGHWGLPSTTKSTTCNRASDGVSLLKESNKITDRPRRFFRYHTDYNNSGSDHTGSTEPVFSEDTKMKQKKKKRFRLRKLFRFGETNKNRDEASLDSSYNRDETETHHMWDSELGLSPDDIAEWVRAQQTVADKKQARTQARMKFATQENSKIKINVRPAEPSPSGTPYSLRRESSLPFVQAIEEPPMTAEFTEEYEDETLNNINSLRKYPSKRRQRKSSRNSAGSNRIDFTGGISSSATYEMEEREGSSDLADDMTQMRSIVDLMMTRMELYEKQSDSLVQASLVYHDDSKKKKKKKRRKKRPKETIGATATNTSEAETSEKKKKKKTKKKKKKRHVDQKLSDEAKNIDQWIIKLEEMQNIYQERLLLTKNQLETLKDNQAETNKKIIAGYEKRLKAKARSSTCAHEDEEPKVDSTNRSRSTHSSRSTGEESSLWDSGRIEYAPDMEGSSHTLSSRLSEKSVTFNPTVSVATTWSRYDMCPREKFAYWSGDGDEDISDELLDMLTKRWNDKKQSEDAEFESISRQMGNKKFLGEDTPLPSHLFSDYIKQRLPATEREGNEGYTYTVGIRD